MSAVLTLLPWLAGTINASQLRVWARSADRLDAGIVTGIEYPSPANVAAICDALADLCDEAECSHASDLAGTFVTAQENERAALDDVRKWEDDYAVKDEEHGKTLLALDEAIEERDAWREWAKRVRDRVGVLLDDMPEQP